MFVQGFEEGLGQGQEREQVLGQTQGKGAERWSDTGVEEEFWSVKVSVLPLDAGCNCVSGLSSGFGLKGWAGVGRSGGVTYSPTESYGSSGSFCSADTAGRPSGYAGLPALL